MNTRMDVAPHGEPTGITITLSVKEAIELEVLLTQARMWAGSHEQRNITLSREVSETLAKDIAKVIRAAHEYRNQRAFSNLSVPLTLQETDRLTELAHGFNHIEDYVRQLVKNHLLDNTHYDDGQGYTQREGIVSAASDTNKYTPYSRKTHLTVTGLGD